MGTFHFKEFSVAQDVNPQKIGTDSMLLGAWCASSVSTAKHILDIGTGTGVLALMMAQSFPDANVTAIEPIAASCDEAILNFKNSPYQNRILGIHTRLQNFGSMDKFDLIICNPPYFKTSYLSEDDLRNNARHQEDLSAYELYECAEELLSDEGSLFVVIPQSEITEHLERAFDNDLFLKAITHTVREDGERKRALLQLTREDLEPLENEILVKDSNNKYSKEYISLTRQFYKKNLEQE